MEVKEPPFWRDESIKIKLQQVHDLLRTYPQYCKSYKSYSY
jgi:hypothetical protein